MLSFVPVHLCLCATVVQTPRYSKFQTAFAGCRTKVIDTIKVSSRLLSRLVDHKVLTQQHVQDVKVQTRCHLSLSNYHLLYFCTSRLVR